MCLMNCSSISILQNRIENILNEPASNEVMSRMVQNQNTVQTDPNSKSATVR